jgi:hypothetical protein
MRITPAVAEWLHRPDSTPRPPQGAGPAAWICVAGTGDLKLSPAELGAADMVGRCLADVSFGMITGGWAGVDHVAARAFWERLAELGVESPETYLQHIVPHGKPPDFQRGTTRYVGEDPALFEASVSFADAVVIIGGRGATGKVGETALRRGIPVIPIRNTGGDADRLHKQILERWPDHAPFPIDREEFAAATTAGKNLPESLRRILRMLPGRRRIAIALTESVLRIASEILIRDQPAQFGPWVTSRIEHTLGVTPEFRLGRYQVRNAEFFEFARRGGYADAALWHPAAPRDDFRCKDRAMWGPADWESGMKFPADEADRPVTGICCYEAEAFCAWLNQAEAVPGWEWRLPSEDMWEYAARMRSGTGPTPYPWGERFENDRCNCTRTGLHRTSKVGSFPDGNSPDGCADLAGNVWEFVDPRGTPGDKCVLRGGSFRNSEYEVQSHLRLFGVPRDHRPVDFGFRCALVRMDY